MVDAVNLNFVCTGRHVICICRQLDVVGVRGRRNVRSSLRQRGQANGGDDHVQVGREDGISLH